MIKVVAKDNSKVKPAGHARIWSVLVLLILAGFIAAGRASAGASVFDQVTTPGRPFYLMLRTHRGPLALGGVTGDVWIDEQPVGVVLTGADGYGFLKYTATTTGVFSLRVRTAAGEAEGRLMVINASDRAILFEAETLLWQSLIRNRSAVSRRIMRQMAEDFKLVYLCGLMGKATIRQLIEDQELPDRVILAGKDRKQFEKLSNRGILIFAVVGSAAFIDAARDFTPRRFSFEKAPQANHVAGWEDLLNRLKQEGESP